VNQDFALLATPANARRLLLLQRAGQIELTPAILELAAEDCLEASALDSLVCPDNPVKRIISQFLLDCQLRGIVQPAYHPEFEALALLNTVRLTTPSQVIVLSSYRRTWLSGAIAVPVRCQTLGWLEQNLATVDRHSVVIYEPDYHVNQHQNSLRFLVREFPRFIIYDSREIGRLSHWSEWARLLFPTMPHPLLPHLAKDVPAYWRSLPLAAFAVFYNVCLFPDLMTADMQAQLID